MACRYTAWWKRERSGGVDVYSGLACAASEKLVYTSSAYFILVSSSAHSRPMNA
jgi:hypothetical protein